MRLKFDFSSMTDSVVDGGVSSKTILKDKQRIALAFDELSTDKKQGRLSWTSLALDTDAVDKIEPYCKEVCAKAESLIVFGIGGAASGIKSLAWALLHLNHNQLSKKQRGNVPKIFVEDNVDPERIAALFEAVNINKTYFNFVTKSGETLETLSQFLIVYGLLKARLGKKKARERIIITTSGRGSLYDVAVKEGFKHFLLPQDVGGRYTAFSLASLVPLGIMGADLKVLLKGAAEMDAACSSPDIYQNPALMSAYLHYKGITSGKNISVMMPYSEALKYTADFYAQLWGESLAKSTEKGGKTVYVGQTPVRALGATDQHSQLDLYTHGPRDKIVTFLAVEEFRGGVTVPDDTEISDFAYLKGKSLSDIMQAERKGTAYALTKAGRPNYTIFMPCICEYTMGELLTYFMYQTAYAARLLNVDVSYRPGLAEGKAFTLSMLGRSGYAGSTPPLEAGEAELFKISK